MAGGVPLPGSVPAIAWRAGLDLNPVDAGDPDAGRWLQCLVWPEHRDRAATLTAALRVAAEAAPPVSAGDLVDGLPALLDAAAPGMTTVVVHSATLAYAEQDKRAALTALLVRRWAHRLGMEGPRVLPELAGQLPAGVDVNGRFLVSLDDRLLALAHPHGRALTWL